MPCTPEAVAVLRKDNVLIAPAIAAGSGGVKLIFLNLFMIFFCRICLLLMLDISQICCTSSSSVSIFYFSFLSPCLG